jgi:hypothetical protein
MIQFYQKGQPFTVRTPYLLVWIFLTINKQKQAIYAYFSFCAYVLLRTRNLGQHFLDISKKKM